MSNKFFEHQVLPHNSPVSPVENLASETSEAFSKVGKLIGTSTIYPSISKAIGNYILADLSYHGVTQVRADSVSVIEGSSDIILSYVPTGDSISVSYLEGPIGSEVTEYLEEVPVNSVFSNKKQFKKNGRVISLSGNLTGKTLKISYTGIEPSLSGRNIKPNVLKMTNGSYLRPLVEIKEKEYKVEYDVNIQGSLTKYFNGNISDKDFLYLIAKKGNDYIILNYSSVTISNGTMTFIFDTDLEETYSQVLVYALNVTIADLLETLYKEFKNHNHSKAALESPIDHKNIVNNYQNTDTIFYKDNQTPNYPHPQFLNREGYNPKATAAYENSLLGDLLLAAKITSNDSSFKSISKESVRLLFGDPIAGSKLYFDPEIKSLNLLTGSTLHGLNIVVGTGRKALSINNENFFIKEETNSTSIKGKSNVVSIVDDSTSPATLETKNIVAKGISNLDEVLSQNITIGNTRVTTDGTDTFINPLDDTLDTSLIIKSNTKVENIEILKGIVKNLSLQGSISASEEVALLNKDGSFSFDLSKSFLDIEQKDGKESGLQIGFNKRKLKLYSSDYQGNQGTGTDTSFYTETFADSALYFIRSTENPIISRGKTYVYKKDVEGASRIDSLKDWLRTPIFVGDIDSYSISLEVSDPLGRKGLKIGSTRLSVIGSSMDCPSGTTILESQDALHIVKPLKEEEVECTSIAYQSVNTGSLQVFGDASIDSNVFVIGDITTSETITAADLVVNESTALRNLTVSGNAVFAAKSQFIGAIEIQNNMTVSGALDLGGSVTASDGTFEKFVHIGEALTVSGQAIFDDNVIVQGNFYTASNFTTQGTLNAGNIKVGDIVSGSVSAQGAIVAIGSLTAEGPTTLKGNVAALGNIHSEGSVTAQGEMTADSLYVITDTTLIGRVNIEGSINIVSNSVSIGNTDASLLLYGNLQLTGKTATISGDTTIAGTLSVISNTRFGSNIEVSGDLSASALSVNSNAIIRGTLSAQSGEFSKKLYLQDGFKTSGPSEFTSIRGSLVDTDEIQAHTVYIRDSLAMGPDASVKASVIEGDIFLQKDAGVTSTFKGAVDFNTGVKFSDEGLVVGNKEIARSRNTSGCYITNNVIRMGNNSTIQAVKIFANKGLPSDGNKDANAGFCFSSNTAQGGQDGDTGFFATNPTSLDNSNIEVWIDNSQKYVFFKQNIAYNSKDNNHLKAVVTLEMLQAALSNTAANINSAVNSTAASSWPVGSIYITVANDNPNKLMGFGTWVRYGAGRTLVGRETGNVNETGGVMQGSVQRPSGWNLSTTGAIFGDFIHKLAYNEMPKHTHKLFSGYIDKTRGASGSSGSRAYNVTQYTNWEKDVMDDAYKNKVTTEGGDQPHNNVQPSIVVNMWHRVA